jgi:hypothetical protein
MRSCPKTWPHPTCSRGFSGRHQPLFPGNQGSSALAEASGQDTALSLSLSMAGGAQRTPRKGHWEPTSQKPPHPTPQASPRRATGSEL